MDTYNNFIRIILQNAQKGNVDNQNLQLPEKYNNRQLYLIPMNGKPEEADLLENLLETTKNIKQVPFITEDFSFLDNDPLYEFLSKQNITYITALMQFEPIIVDFYKQNGPHKYSDELIDAIVISLISSIPHIGYERFLFLTNMDPESAEKKTNEVKNFLENQGESLQTNSEEIITELLCIANSFNKQILDKYLLDFDDSTALIAYLNFTHIPLFLIDTIPQKYLLQKDEIESVIEYHKNIVNALREYANKKNKDSEKKEITDSATQENKKTDQNNFQLIIGDQNQTLGELKKQTGSTENKNVLLHDLENKIQLINEMRRKVTDDFYNQIKELDLQEE